MSLTSGIKHASIALGLYHPTRWLSRRMRPRELRAHVADVAFFRSLLPTGALCFDIGANVGEKSEALLAAGVRVVAFEPNPMVLPELKARCGRSERWTYVPAAVGSEGGISTLYVCAQSERTSMLRELEEDVIGTCHVPVVTADAAVRAFGPPHYCKVDVEGWELEVLNGLSHRVPLLSFEFHLTPTDTLKTLRCLKRLRELGPGEVNITTSERPGFLLPEWIPLDRFMEWFPGNLHRMMHEPRHGSTTNGDLFIRRNPGAAA